MIKSMAALWVRAQVAEKHVEPIYVSLPSTRSSSSSSSAADLSTIADENGDIHPPVSSLLSSAESLAIRRQTSTYFLALRLSASSASITPSGINTAELRTKRKLQTFPQWSGDMNNSKSRLTKRNDLKKGLVLRWIQRTSDLHLFTGTY